MVTRVLHTDNDDDNDNNNNNNNNNNSNINNSNNNNNRIFSQDNPHCKSTAITGSFNIKA